MINYVSKLYKDFECIKFEGKIIKVVFHIFRQNIILSKYYIIIN